MPKIPTATLSPFWQTADKQTVRFYQGNVTDVLSKLPEKSVHCCVTSPPYWALRDYGTGTWEGGDSECDHESAKIKGRADYGFSDACQKQGTNPNAGFSSYHEQCPKCGANRIDQQIGSEPSPDCGTHGQTQCNRCFVCAMVKVFREVRRVLRDDGVLWLNLGDSYAGTSYGYAGDEANEKYRLKCLAEGRTPSMISAKSRGQKTTEAVVGKKANSGLKPGNLVGIPWRVALALQYDGWILRQDVIWAKPSPMPESVTNRCTKSHEYMFLLVKRSGYYYDAEAIKEKSDPKHFSRYNSEFNVGPKELAGAGRPGAASNTAGIKPVLENRNKRSVWTVSSESYSGAHFACVDSQTEALTKTGWKTHDKLQDGELIAAYSVNTDVLTWQPASFHRYDYDGELVVFDKRDTSQWLTPNHRCLVMSRKHCVRVKLAENVGQGDHFLMTAELVDDHEVSIGDDMASLVGWYTSEGHRGGDTRAYINQSVSANPENVERIRQLLVRLDADFKFSVGNDVYRGEVRLDGCFRIRGPIALQLLELCPDKMVTDELTRLPTSELHSLLNSFVLGDGHIREDDRSCIVQKSKAHIDRLQIIAIKLGYRSHVSQREDGVHVLYLTDGRWLCARGTNGAWEGIQRVPYRGIVWCPSVRSGFWLARRDGKPFITGNTFPKKLIEPCILAGTSEHGCCARCGAPWRRVVEKQQLKRERPNDYVKRTGEDGTGNSCANSVAGVDVRTIGWEPTCACYGRFEKRKGKRLGYGSYHDHKGDGVEYGLRQKGKGPASNPGMPSKEFDATIVEYISDLPLDEHPIKPCVVLDPFVGSGTTCCVALAHGLHSVGIDLSSKYLKENAVPRIEGELLSRPALTWLAGREQRSVVIGREA